MDKQDGVEELAAKVHSVYCFYYKDRYGKPYWTNGDYSKLDEQTKDADRYMARFMLSMQSSPAATVEQDVVEELASIFYGELQHSFDFSTCRTFAQVAIEKGLVKPSPADGKGGLVPLDEKEVTKILDATIKECESMPESFEAIQYAPTRTMAMRIVAKFGTAPSKDVERVSFPLTPSNVFDLIRCMNFFKSSRMPKQQDAMNLANNICEIFSPPQARVVPTVEEIEAELWAEENKCGFKPAYKTLAQAISKLLKGEK